MAIDKLTLEIAKKLIDDAIEERGEDYAYKRDLGSDCMYVHVDEVWDEDEERYVRAENGAVPGCIVGLALSNHGVPLDELSKVEHNDAEMALSLLASKGLLSFDEHAATYFYRAQVAQDRGDTWGEAREAARIYLKADMKD